MTSPVDSVMADVIWDALDAGLIVLDSDLVVQGWNGWMASATGLSAEAVVGRPLVGLGLGPGADRLSSIARAACETGASRLLTHALHPALLSLRTRAGRPLIHDVTVRPVGGPPHCRCLIQIVDVTVGAERDAILRQRQNARYDAVVLSAPDAILTLDQHGVIQLANPAASAEFGYAADELLGKPLLGFVADSGAWTVAWQGVLAGEDVHWPVELEVRRKNGSLSYVDASASLWRNDARVFVTAILRDVNERRANDVALRRLNETLEERVTARTADLERAHEQIRQSQKMEAVGQLTGGIAHDFNNLLTPILGGLDILHRRGVGDPRGNRLVDAAMQSADRARILVQRLLAFARQQPLQTSAVDLGEVVTNMAELVGSTLGPRIRLVTDVESGLPAAQADPNQLEMALLNLAVNARDAMTDGGILTVGARHRSADARSNLAPGDYVCLTVSDTGAGMDAETLARCIEPFYSTKEIGKGTGLGLSMIHGLAAQLGGALEISSVVGVGTNVSIWLPVATEDLPAAPRSTKANAVDGGGIALLVDDEELIRASTAQMLVDMGYEVIEAGSAREALDILKSTQVDLLLTDHLMPGMSGAEFARQILAHTPTMRVLIISGYAELEDLAPELPRLIKPFRQAELAAAIASLN